MFSSSPQGGQSKLNICIHGRFLRKPFAMVEKLANEWVVQPRLPFLNECKLKASIVSTTGKKGNWGPNVAILMPMQEPKSEFSLNKLVVAELKILSGSALLPVQDVVHGRPNLKFGLHFGDMGESDLYTVGKEEFLRKEVVGSQVEPHK